MTERWQSELVKLRRAELGSNLWDRIAEGPRLEPPRPSTSSRALAAAVAFAVLVAAGALVWNVFRPFGTEPATLGGSDVVRVPPRGEAAPFFLPDGEPVFVVHLQDGLVAAVDAFSPHRDWGIGQLVAWCPSKFYFVAWPDGSFFTRSGHWSTGRSAVPGLDSVSFDVLSRDASGDPRTLRLGDVGPPWGVGHGNVTSRRPVPARACGLADGDRSQIVTHPIDGSKVWPTPAAAARAETSDWMWVQRTLLVSPMDPSGCAPKSMGTRAGTAPGSPASAGAGSSTSFRSSRRRGTHSRTPGWFGPITARSSRSPFRPGSRRKRRGVRRSAADADLGGYRPSEGRTGRGDDD